MKQRITVTVDSDSYQLLKAYDVNISGLVSTTMQNEARRLRAERWKAENQEGIKERVVIVCLWMSRVTLLTRPGDGW